MNTQNYVDISLCPEFLQLSSDADFVDIELRARFHPTVKSLNPFNLQPYVLSNLLSIIRNLNLKQD